MAFKDVESKLFAQQLCNDIHDDCSAEAASEKQIDQGILSCCHNDRDLRGEVHCLGPWQGVSEIRSPRGEARRPKVANCVPKGWRRIVKSDEKPLCDNEPFRSDLLDGFLMKNSSVYSVSSGTLPRGLYSGCVVPRRHIQARKTKPPRVDLLDSGRL